MGNYCSGILHHEPIPKRKQQSPDTSTKPIPNHSSTRWSRTLSSFSSSKKRRDDNGYGAIANLDNMSIDAVIHQQAIAVAASAVYGRRQGKGEGHEMTFDRSSSLKCMDGVYKKGSLPRSLSTRPRSSTDPLLQPHQLLNQNAKLDLETNHFVLVHGGGFGAWCWYKTISLFEARGFKVTAVDLTGSGIHSVDPNSITSLSQYVKPLTDFLHNLAGEEKVILVGHDLGGACISYAMELFPSKVSKAIYVAATMLIKGQSAFDIYSREGNSDDLMHRTQIFLYANGKDHPPTAVDLDKSLLTDLLFNQSPTKDVALASVSMRPIPFAPVLEKLSLTEENFGRIRRFFIETAEDNALKMPLQDAMVNANPPEKVYLLKGADHSPFFSKPQALHKLLVEIAYMK
ncbi:hypothetical protein Droror1_Dr00022552 [Drosera rotundifolia]